MRFTARKVFAAVMFCFLVSGMAGLVYQVVWTRYLALFLGHTSYAVVVVLVAFMGGLAIGNAWLGAKADRVANPLALYGWLEIGIGLYAGLFPTYFNLCHSVFVHLASNFQPGSSPILLLKFLFGLATVLCPTTLMGATFPVLTRFVTHAMSELREKVAALYFINSFGAVLGCLVADFWWIPSFGLELTVMAGAGMNLVAGLFALYVSKQPFQEETTAPVPKEPGPLESFSAGELRLAVVGIGLSGFVAMLYEVAWTRILGLALGATTHAFSLMLVTFISGITLGAWIVYRTRRIVRSLDGFGWTELVLAVAVLISMMFYAEVPYWFLKGASLLARKPGTYPLYEFWQAIICFGVMLVPAACLGLTLPLVSRIATVELAHTGRSVGRVFAVNTVGTVLGAICTGLLLMPWLGLARTFALGIVINAAIGLSIVCRGRWRIPGVMGALVGALCFVWVIGAVFNDQWQHTFSAGLWRFPQPPPSWRAFQEQVNNGKILYYKDGAGSTVTVISDLQENHEVLSLKVNGKTDAASALDVTTQLLAAHIPLLLHPSSQQVLVVGAGSGMTADAAAQHSSVQHVDVVEISPEVLEGAQVFAKYNHRYWENPKVKVTVEDAKSFLKISRQRYDVIISEPSNPWMAGVAGVFSREYYQDCRSRLAANGVIAQWVQTYETSDELLGTVLRTFSSVFPHLSIWQTSSADLLLIGSIEPLPVDLNAMHARIVEPAVSADLGRIEIVSLPALLSIQAVSQQNGAFVASPDGPIHSDFYPVLEFQAARAFFLLGRAQHWRYFDEKYSTRPTTLLGDYVKEHPLTEEDFRTIGRFYMAYRLPESDIFQTLVLRWLREKPEATLPMDLMAEVPESPTSAELHALRLAPMNDFLLQLASQDPEPLRQYESDLMRTYRAHRSTFNPPPTNYLAAVLGRLLQTDPANQRVYECHLAEIAWDHGDDSSFAVWANRAFDANLATGGPKSFALDPSAPQRVFTRRIENLWRSGQSKAAWDVCQEAGRLGLFGSDALLDLVERKVEANVAESNAAPKD